VDRLDAMKVFIVTLDEGSLAGAARALRRSPASITRAIGYLETHVGSPLLHRTTRAMRLSPVGERYAAACRRIIADLEEAELHAAGERSAPHGILTLSAPPICGEEILLPIVNSFLRAYPSVSMRLLLVDRHVSLIDEGVDVALRLGALPDSSLVAVKVGGEIRRVVAAAPRYLCQHPRIDKPADLAKHQIIAVTHFGMDSWSFPPASGSAVSRTVNFTPRLLASSVRAAVSSAVDGLGVTRLYAYHLAERVRDRQLQIVLADAEPPPMPAHLVVQPARTAVPKVRAFVDFAVPRLRAEFTRLAAEAGRLESFGAAA
jgi:DNA-binding transcriptional LysR family regulator